jgi:hypothetical protein
MQEFETDTGTIYVIHVRGVLDPTWSHWFDDWSITAADDGTMFLRGLVQDQTALYGIIGKLRDLALALISCMLERDGSSVAEGCCSCAAQHR